MTHLDQDRLIAKIDLAAFIQVFKVLDYVADKSSSYRGSKLIRKSIQMLSKEIDRAIVLGGQLKMSSFTKPLTVTKVFKGKKRFLFFFERSVWVWSLDRSFQYYVGDKKSGKVINVDKGYESDGASIPRLLWPIVGHPMGEYAQAAFVHDKVYQYNLFPQKECDEIFLEAMGVLGVGKGIRRVMFYALRLFGHIAYNTATKNLKKRLSL